ncbi:MAG: hypothetical protein ACRETA_06660 [Gammaproteobacteria bacterium]
MSHRYPLLILITVVMIGITGYSGYLISIRTGLPFVAVPVNAHTAVVEQVAGIPLPAGLDAGDRIDLQASGYAARVALLPWILVETNLSVNHRYNYALRKNNALVNVAVSSTDIGPASGGQLLAWITEFNLVLYAAVALLLLWRARGRASAYMTVWVMASWVGTVVSVTNLAGNALLVAQVVATAFFLLARIGFYSTIESLLASVLTSARRALFRTIFLLVLLASAIQQLGGTLVFVFTGWAELLRPAFGLVFSASYLVPLAMLIMSYGAADMALRLRLRWILWGSIVWVVGIFLSNTPVPGLGSVENNAIDTCAYVIALACFLYAVLRHRVVNVSVILDRTLVYGTVTAVVVGVLAAVNSIVQHAALGTSASLLLQIIVPLALGIVLSQVRNYADKFVERVFFRKRYLAEKALQRFARHAARYEQAEPLFAAASLEIRTRIRARGVAFYERNTQGYLALRREGEVGYPEQLGIDDAACVAARAGTRSTDLAEIHSALGTDGYVFPMLANGMLQAILVCANRPGEHYTADELHLLSYVARHLGTALYGLRMRAHTQFVAALSNGAFMAAPEIQIKAQELISAVTTE